MRSVVRQLAKGVWDGEGERKSKQSDTCRGEGGGFLGCRSIYSILDRLSNYRLMYRWQWVTALDGMSFFNYPGERRFHTWNFKEW